MCAHRLYIVVGVARTALPSPAVIPLKDENPTRRTPFVTYLIIAACLGLFFVWQPVFGAGTPVNVETAEGIIQFDEATAFTVENAAIPCEIVQGRPLTVDEVVLTFGQGSPEACGSGSERSSVVFPDKSVWLV